MNTKIFNEDNLTDEDIDQVVTRVKVYLMNDSGDIFLASSNGGLQLPGGHVEEGEDLKSTVIREVKEETGIELNKSEISDPFFQVKHYTKNHRNQNINRLSIVVYYLVKTNQKNNLDNINLTDNEKQNKFSVHSVNIKDFYDTMNNIKVNSDNEINRVIATEILESFEYLENQLLK